MGKSERRKGHDFERRIANAMAPIFPEARRGLSQSRGAGSDACPDVEGTPWWVETKCGRAPRIWAAYAQAEADSDGRAPMVVAHRDRGPTLAVVSLDQMIGLLERLYDERVDPECVCGKGGPPRCIGCHGEPDSGGIYCTDCKCTRDAGG